MPTVPTSEKVQLFFSATELPNLQFMNTADAFAVIYLDQSPTPVCTTELIKDNNNPRWVKNYMMDYKFETIIQEVKICVYQQGSDMRAPLDNLTAHKLIGQTTFRMSDLMKHHLRLELPLSREETILPRAKLIVQGESAADVNDIVYATFHAHGLRNQKGPVDTSDPFFEISRLNEDGTFHLVHRSEHRSNKLNPMWSEMRIPLVTLCNGDYHRPLKFEIFDHYDNGNHRSMGEARISLMKMHKERNKHYPVLERSREGRNGYTNSGNVTVHNFKIEHQPTFVDFITGGLNMNMVVAIDFTSSNGDPQKPESLHYIGSDDKNQYEESILNIGKLIEEYDSDKKYPVYMFGGRPKIREGTFGPAEHDFLLTDGPGADGVNGILETYRRRISDFKLSGPTLIGPLIEATAERTKCTQEAQEYTVLLILTDGEIDDLEDTKAAIIEASYKPLSIVIIGVGSAANFTKMRSLNGTADEPLLKHGGKTARRDIVRFFTYENESCASEFASEVLAKIPQQVLMHMKLEDIYPNSGNEDMEEDADEEEQKVTEDAVN